MSGHQAKVVTDSMLRKMLAHSRKSSHPMRDRVIILLSCKAGLRACEIAGLEWSMLLDPQGKIGKLVVIEDRIAKRQSGRRIPLHPGLKGALTLLRKEGGCDGSVIRSSRGGAMKPNSIVNWFVELYRELNFDGCSSHSGRRTFITTAARSAHRAGGCLRDVQLLAGHRSLSMTQSYIDGDTDAQRRIVSMI
ncbi:MULTISPECIES: tyrosine-type recombinase/integrase [unclassified Mesorhizobium]|uniref:tyrosine-type recombinase/integrase n=1 Tax=unclassified Mesorhizobium TaxID=325217 RepID=UPI00112E9D73|nr:MULTISPECIES: site-specific integrase [unclassified Mesorhizobium]MBZ9998554.1 site-specific integrase [Mesorhizobium sp. B264B2A]MCA0005099.1 site-specific integrase [Mesorhizobium sp. B264B1B]MCA0019721.1 site-specific integrase [Mesorhizobium sp. B264B1A]TPJ45702.1 site-specific integrase [Mesorhizobium sp. B2-6-6]